MKKVIVGMSGGVDSSVAALLLQQQGYEVTGLFMKNWEQDDTNTYCAAAADLADAKAVADKLGIGLHVVNFAREYWDNVFNHFLAEYQAGRTPNPDVLCNKEIKFKAFWKYARQLGADFIATGHYAKTKAGQLYKASDRNKDQTYFLHAIEPAVLPSTLFPLGHLQKTAVRELARQHRFITSDKKDSTGICFIGERRFKQFLQEFILAQPGEIRSSQGEYLGHHDGLMFYTLGQRQGLGLGGRACNASPWYLVDKQLTTNTLIVAQGADHPLLYAQGLLCGPIHWLTPPPALPFTCQAKTRYRQAEQACVISPALAEGHCIMFAFAQRAITPGQYVVFYDKNQCIGGAVINDLIR